MASKKNDDLPPPGQSSSFLSTGMIAKNADAKEAAKSKVPAPEIDPERHLKRIRDAFQVSVRIQDLVRIRPRSPPPQSGEAEEMVHLVRRAYHCLHANSEPQHTSFYEVFLYGMYENKSSSESCLMYYSIALNKSPEVLLELVHSFRSCARFKEVTSSH